MSCTEDIKAFRFVLEKQSLYINNRSTDPTVMTWGNLYSLSCVPCDALRATHPFSPVPMFVCHGCQFPAYLALHCVSSVWCTRCPCCYYPRTLPGRARGRFPPIIVISNGQPRGREQERESERQRQRQRDLEGKNGGRLQLPVTFIPRVWQ